MAESQGVAQIGSTVQGQAVQAKDIIISGEISGPSTMYRKALVDTIVPLVPGRLIYDNHLYIDVFPRITPVVEQYPTNAKFQFTVRAPYPYWRELEETSTNVAGLEPMFKFPINYGDTYFENPKTHMFGKRIQTYFTNVINKGNVSAPFSVVFIAKTALSNPYITKVSTLEFIKINKAMVAGERITVDMTGSSLKVTTSIQGVESNAMQYFNIDSTLFELDIGDNLIRYDSDVNREGLDCRITFSPTWSGAYGDDKTYV